MPEGHTIHRMARDHGKWFAGQRLTVASPQGRFESEAQSLNGKVLKTVEAHGKHLYYVFTGGSVLHIHLGLYGKFRLFKNPPPEPRGAVRVQRTDCALPLSRLNADERLAIYKKEVCAACGSRVDSWSLANRQMYACATCQR